MKPFTLVFMNIVTAFLLFAYSATAHTSAHFNVSPSGISDTLPAGDTTNFKKVEKEAYFTGGESAWAKFLTKNINPDIPIKKNAPPGNYTVIIQFIVNKNGTLDVEALTNFGYGMEEEVVRAIKKSPLWIPAEQDGKKVRAYRKQPVTFSVPEKRRKRSKD